MNRVYTKIVVLLSLLLSSIFIMADESSTTYIISPKDGDIIKGEVKVVFGLKGKGVAPAGVKKENTGHHHLLIDVEKLPDMNKPIPKDKHHHHFGGGQTEVILTLEPGVHTLQLLLGDHSHIPHKKPLVSDKITITVEQ